MGADTRIEDRIVFKLNDGCLTGIHRRMPRLENCPALSKRAFRAFASGWSYFRSKSSCATVHDES
jgi:hypothetical protein